MKIIRMCVLQCCMSIMFFGCGGGSNVGGAGSITASSTIVEPRSSNSSVLSSVIQSISSSSLPSDKNKTYITIKSDEGDYVGLGNSYSYSLLNAIIQVTTDGATLNIKIEGDEEWQAVIRPSSSLPVLTVGIFSNLPAFNIGDPTARGMNWGGGSRGCGELSGSIIINNIEYNNGKLEVLDFDFDQVCRNATAGLHGKVHWVASDTTIPVGPAFPIPTNLWVPEAGSTPSGRNFVYLQSDVGDFVGGGGNYLYTQENSSLMFSSSGNAFNITVLGDQNWNGKFVTMTPLSNLQIGYYSNLTNNPTRGISVWSGINRSCSPVSWVAIDSVTYAGPDLVAIDARFEQHCIAGGPALRGVIHWAVGDKTFPPGPISPAPQNLWAPENGTTPISGNYVYLKSEPGGYIGLGNSYSYTQANSIMTVSDSSGYLGVGRWLKIGVNGDQEWVGEFQTMDVLSQFKPGYYGNLKRLISRNPVKGGLDWGGEGRGCNELSGWFVVDSVVYSAGVLIALDLRFEQHCENALSPALYGKIHWVAGDITSPPDPVFPVPLDLWEPKSGSTPPVGNYVFLDSEDGDFVGEGKTQIYTPTNSLLTLTESKGHVYVTAIVSEDVLVMAANFQGMYTLPQLKPGYYGSLLRYPFHNPAHGGMDVDVNSRGCNGIFGWFVIDNVVYSNDTLVSIDLRFEQHCEGDAPSLHGKIHWVQ